MSYAMVHRGMGLAPDPGITAMQPAPYSEPSAGGTLVMGIVVVGVIGLIGLLIYEGMKTQRQIVHEQGVGKALEYQGGMAAIGVLGSAMTRNKRRRRARRRRR